MLKNVFYLILRQIIGVITGLITIIILARFYGSEIQGEYTSIILVPTLIITLLNLGISTSISYYLSSNRITLTLIKNWAYKSIFYLSIISILSLLIFITFSKNSYNPGNILYIIFTVILIPFLQYNNIMSGFFQGLEKFKTFGIIISFGQLMGLLFTIFFTFILPISVHAPLFAYFLSQIAISLYINIELKKLFKLRVNNENISNQITYYEFYKYGIKTHLTNILAFLLYRVDILLITFYLNSKEVAYYSTGVAIVEKFWIVSQSFSSVLFPKLSSNIKNKNQITELISRNILWLTLIICILIFPSISLIVDLLFGKEYLSAVIVIKILLVGMVFGSIPRIIATHFSANGYPEYNLFTSFFLVIFNTVLNIILIPRLGITGAAISTALAYVFNFITKIFIYKKIFRGSLKGLIFLNKNDIFLLKKQFNKFLLKGKINKIVGRKNS